MAETTKTQPNPSDLGGTSRQPHNDARQNNQQANPTTENQVTATAPGVVATHEVNQAPTTASVSDAQTGLEPEPAPQTSGETEGKYRITNGKHSYLDSKGNRKVATKGDTVNISRTFFERNRNRFEEVGK